MSDIAVRVERLSKQYKLGRRQESYKSLRDRLAALPSAVLGAARRGRA